MSRTNTIIEELNKISINRNKHIVIENRAEHVINSAIHLIEHIENHYDSQTSKDLKNRLINSIRGKDSRKFSRGIRNVIKESQKRHK